MAAMSHERLLWQVLFADALDGLKEYRRALVSVCLCSCHLGLPLVSQEIKQAEPFIWCMQKYYRQAQQLFHISSLGQVICVPFCHSSVCKHLVIAPKMPST